MRMHVFLLGALVSLLMSAGGPAARTATAAGQEVDEPVRPRLVRRSSELVGTPQVPGLRQVFVRGQLMWVSEGAWWTNAELVEELGLAEGQRASVEGAFADHVDTIVANIGLLEQREAELASLLHAETLDRNSASIQIESVVLARAELERANSQMTLEMREALTRDQWLRLQAWWMGENEDRVTIPEPRRR